MKKAVRLDKFLADAGAGTRSEVKKFIQKGKVQVNGVPAKKSEIKVSEEDEVVLDGNRISQAPEFEMCIRDRSRYSAVQERPGL